MHAMIFEHDHKSLRLETDMPVPKPGRQEVLITVHTCGVCRPDLHVVDGELEHPVLPLVPGHEIVGTVREIGALVPAALRAIRWGGTVVCAGIHMSDIPSFPYNVLWEERVVRSVANLTRQNEEEFFAIAAQIPARTTTTSFPLSSANDALEQLREGQFEGAAVPEAHGADEPDPLTWRKPVFNPVVANPHFGADNKEMNNDN